VICMHEITVAVAAADGRRAVSLRRCVEAVAAGTSLPTRLLVVDQSGGTKIATSVGSLRCVFEVECVAQPRLGLSASRNLALDRLPDGIVAVTDDDCVPEPGWLAAIAKAFAEDPGLAAVTGPVLPLPPEGERTAAVSSRSRLDAQIFNARTAPWHVGTGGNMAFNRAKLGDRRFDMRLGAGTPGRAGEDLDLIDRLLAAGERIRYEPAAVVRHERQTPARRVASRYGYGCGVGAMVGLGLRRQDYGAAQHLARWILLRARLAVGRHAFGEELRVLAGTGRGLVYGIRGR
jgi:glycosyltransferase involved in cell wall biosynthesis